MESKKIVVRYYLSQLGQKAEILAGRSGEYERTANVIADSEILQSQYIRINGQGGVELDKNFPYDGWTCGFGGYELRTKDGKYFTHPLKIDEYTSDKVLSDLEITEIYRGRIVKKYTDQLVEEYNLRAEADLENQHRDKIRQFLKLYSEGKLYYRRENGQFDKI